MIPVCLRHHDVDLFIDNGVDGFYADRPEELAAFIGEAMGETGLLAAMSAAAGRKPSTCSTTTVTSRPGCAALGNRLT